MRAGRVFAALLLGWLPLAEQALAQTQETEPNDSPATAQTAVRGTSVKATISPYVQETGYRDFDYWKITANAGDTIFVDIDADEFGSKMDMGISLLASDGTTFLAGNSEWDGMDPHLEYVATTTGTYYVAAGTSLTTTPWGSSQPYTIHFFKVTCPANDAEPNDTPQTATPAAVGQTMHASSCPGTDVDFFRFELEPGTYEWNFVMDPHERPAFGSAAYIEGWIVLYAADGKTEIAKTLREDPLDRIEYTVTTPGTYYIAAEIWPGGIRYTYTLSSRQVSGPAPGDPVTTRAEIANWGIKGAAVAANGDVWLTSWDHHGIRRITPQGTASDVALSIEAPRGIAFDAAGNLLIVNVYPTSEMGVLSLSPTGALSRLITDSRVGGGIAVGRDGSIWLTSSTWLLLRYDRQGAFVAAYDVAAATDGHDRPRDVAMAPSGELYFATRRDLYRLRDGQAERVVHYDPMITYNPTPDDVGAFAFDVQGNIYIPNGAAGVVNLHDATGKWLETFSYQPAAPERIFFGRNADGATNGRLYAVDQNKLIEFNAAGVRAPGFPVQPPQASQDPSTPTTAQAIAELLKPGSLSAAQLTLLDQQGNKNGRYDVGDLRALLIRAGVLAASQREQ